MKSLIRVSFQILISLLFFCCSSIKSPKESLGKIWPTENFGSIENRKALDSLLYSESNKIINPLKPLVIIYYPGKDDCNSSGGSTRESIEVWYNEMEIGINKISESNIIYIYKDATGLYDKNDGNKTWYKDPRQIIERNFFKETPICSGYVLISKEGNYISSRSEFDKKFLWKRLEYLINKDK